MPQTLREAPSIPERTFGDSFRTILDAAGPGIVAVGLFGLAALALLLFYRRLRHGGETPTRGRRFLVFSASLLVMNLAAYSAGIQLASNAHVKEVYQNAGLSLIQFSLALATLLGTSVFVLFLVVGHRVGKR